MTLTRSEIKNLVGETLGEILGDDEISLGDDTTADDVEDWDSTNHVRLIIALESRLGIQFQTQEITSPETVGQLVDLIHKKLA